MPSAQAQSVAHLLLTMYFTGVAAPLLALLCTPVDCRTTHVATVHSHAGMAAGKGVGRMAGHVISFQTLHVLQPAEQSGAGRFCICFMRSVGSTF